MSSLLCLTRIYIKISGCGPLAIASNCIYPCIPFTSQIPFIPFHRSHLMALLVKRCPIILDGAAVVIRQNGEKFTSSWNSALCGQKSKLFFLRPDVGIAIITYTFLFYL